MQCKYALLAFPRIGQFPDLTQNHDLGFSTVILQNPNSVLSTITQDHWKQWLGSLAWENLFKTHHVVINHCSTSTPEILDHENKLLTDHLTENVYKALLLVAPFCGTGGKIHRLTGRGNVTSTNVSISDIREYSIIDQWVMPGFRHHPDYWSWMRGTFTEMVVINEWKKLIQSLHQIRDQSKVYLFHLALEVFRSGLKESWADIVFPHIVRSIETLIALPKTSVLKRHYGPSHSSAKEFAVRILKYYPTGSQLYQIPRAHLSQRFEDIYQLRSDSVHGKPLAWTLRQINPDLTDDDIRVLEYISETAARNLLKSVLSNPSWITASKDRSKLEQAWLSGTI